ncbi:MAG: type II secretion system protein GspD, partial [Planctomycetota bacterium]
AGGANQKTDVFSVDTRIVPDELSNSLLIQAEEPIFLQILSLLEGTANIPGLDRAPRRVLIETQVWEVGTPQDNMTIGFELAGLQNTKRGEFRPQAATTFGLSQLGFDPVTGSITRIPNVGTGLTTVLTKDVFNKLPVIMTAIANFSKSRAITTPFALTNDNQLAHFDVTLTTSYATNTLTTGFSQQSFQQLQIPTSIDVTPQVNSEDNLTLDVKIAISTASSSPGPGAPPNVNARNLSAIVTVPNMHYVVFGGLESESYDQSEQKVPFLGDIPILGHLFKTKTWNHSKSKIYIFVRATIFSSDKAITRISEDMREQAHVLAEQDEWIPPVVSERLVKAPWKTIQDDVFEVFGTGSGNPFGSSPKDD